MATTPTAAQCDKYRTQLEELEDAIHDLMIGGSATRIRMNGKETEFRASSLPDMQREKQRLEGLVAKCDGCYRPARSAITILPSDGC